MVGVGTLVAVGVTVISFGSTGAEAGSVLTVSATSGALGGSGFCATGAMLGWVGGAVTCVGAGVVTGAGGVSVLGNALSLTVAAAIAWLTTAANVVGVGSVLVGTARVVTTLCSFFLVVVGAIVSWVVVEVLGTLTVTIGEEIMLAINCAAAAC